MSIRILLADDHQIMRDGLRSLMERETDVAVIGEADTGQKAIELVAELKPDVVLMDIGMPDLNGIEATRRIIAHHPSVRIIALSTFSDKRYVTTMLQAGAAGYVLKAAASGELLRAIRSVIQGQVYLCPEITSTVVDNVLGSDGFPLRRAVAILGAREREILQLVAEGKTSMEMADQLDIAVKTVETHRRNIMKKLDLHSVAELTKYAVREGLTSLEH